MMHRRALLLGLGATIITPSYKGLIRLPAEEWGTAIRFDPTVDVDRLPVDGPYAEMIRQVLKYWQHNGMVMRDHLGSLGAR